MITEVVTKLRDMAKDTLGITTAIPELKPGLRFDKSWLPYAVIEVGVARQVNAYAAKDYVLNLPIFIHFLVSYTASADSEVSGARELCEALAEAVFDDHTLGGNSQDTRVEAIGPNESVLGWLETSLDSVDTCSLELSIDVVR